MMPSHVSMELKNDPSEIERMSSAIAEFGARNNLPARSIGNLQLAMEELVVNVINHGFPQGGEHTIRVDMHSEDRTVVARIEDDGVEFNPMHAKPPDTTLGIADRPIGGLGIHLVKTICNKLEYRREGNRNILQVAIGA